MKLFKNNYLLRLLDFSNGMLGVFLIIDTSVHVDQGRSTRLRNRGINNNEATSTILVPFLSIAKLTE